MSGEELKTLICKLTGITLAEIARRMGQSPQALNSKLNASDVKSGVIEEMCKKLDVPISQIYGYSEMEVKSSNAEAANDIPFHVYKELLNRYEIVLRENENLRVEIKNLRNGIGENADNKITFSVTPEGIVASNPKLQGKTKKKKKKFIIDAERAYDMFLSMMTDSNRKPSNTSKHNGGSKSGKSVNPGSLK